MLRMTPVEPGVHAEDGGSPFLPLIVPDASRAILRTADKAIEGVAVADAVHLVLRQSSKLVCNQTVSKLVFYAQSTSMVISGWATKRKVCNHKHA